MPHITLLDRINRLIGRYRRNSYREIPESRNKYLYLIPIALFTFLIGYWAYSHFSKVRIISEKGKYGLESQIKGVIYEPVFDTIIPEGNGLFRVKQFNRTFLVDGSGNSVLEENKK